MLKHFNPGNLNLRIGFDCFKDFLLSQSLNRKSWNLNMKLDDGQLGKVGPQCNRILKKQVINLYLKLELESST